MKPAGLSREGVRGGGGEGREGGRGRRRGYQWGWLWRRRWWWRRRRRRRRRRKKRGMGQLGTVASKPPPQQTDLESTHDAFSVLSNRALAVTLYTLSP